MCACFDWAQNNKLLTSVRVVTLSKPTFKILRLSIQFKSILLLSQNCQLSVSCLQFSNSIVKSVTLISKVKPIKLCDKQNQAEGNFLFLCPT